MARTITIYDDLKAAAVLGGSLGLLAAATIPAMLDALPAESRWLPLPLPLFLPLVPFPFLVIYGFLAWTGLRLARQRGLEPAPLLTSLWTGQPPPPIGRPAGIALGVGLLCGLFLIGVVSAILQLAPQTFPQLFHPPSFLAALLASGTGAVGEEILCRLFLLSALLRILPASRSGAILAITASALIFGALHGPLGILLFGRIQNVPPVSWIWVVGLNGLVGTVFALLFLRFGIGGAIVGHFGSDFVWHALSVLIA